MEALFVESAGLRYNQWTVPGARKPFAPVR
jgi:hypothetical protein